MSVSLALIPIALTLRAVMGKDQFHNWVDSMQVKVETSFENEQDLLQTLQSAGYDAQEFGGSIKTHLNGENQFFFWERIDGKWHAIFEKGNSEKDIQQFMQDLEHHSQRKIFTGEYTPTVLEKEPAHVFPTNFRDGNILTRTLKEFGVNTIQGNNGDISCTVQGTHLTFRQNGESPFSVEIKNAPSLQDIYMYISDVDDEYKRCVQALVYEKLKQRAAEKNLSVESEEVLEDNSIVITLNIQG
ncbi:hypothetical protein [Neobacillus niacini]|uniref:hypothetical protein n=1 Tax=Neobacillus niacini TaxID=86668 RepID=UPI0020418D2C|nr:hypothetical protein [Neobacillus niacini]MCM3694291.1 hypothetical protein [Neobacillus niacini]